MIELLRRQGYAATGMNDLVRAAKAPTGSIYHHFPGGKREVAAVALREAGAAYAELIPLLLDPYEDLAEGIAAAFVAAGEQLAGTGWANMCPVGSVAAEVCDVEPALREVAVEVMTSWVQRGERYLTGRGLAEADARAVILALLSALEGGFVLARTTRSTESLDAAGRGLASWVGSLRPVSA